MVSLGSHDRFVMVVRMPIIQDGQGESAQGWQGEELDVEVETIYVHGKRRYRWTVYDRDYMVDSGVTRTKPGWKIAVAFASWKYQQTL